MSNKTIELLIVIAMAVFGAGLFAIAITGNTDALAFGRVILACIGVGTVSVSIGLFMNWWINWKY